MPHVPKPWQAKILRSSRILSWSFHKLDEFRRDKEFLKYYPRLYEPDYSGWQLFVHALHSFKEDCQKQNVTFVAVIWPAMGRLERYPFGDVHARIRGALEKEQIPCLDLLKEFADKCSLRMEAAPGLDGHPNEIAHRIAAQSIFEYLLAKNYIDSSYKPKHCWKTPRANWERSLRRTRRTLYSEETEGKK